MLDLPRVEQTKAAAATLVAITALAFYLCWTIVAPFVGALTWAAALATVTDPLRRWMLRHVSRTTAALLIVTLVVLCAAAIALFVSQRLIHEMIRGQQAFRDLQLQPPPWLDTAWSWAASRFDLNQLSRDASAMLAQRVAPAVGKSAAAASRAVLSMLFLFFFVRDQESIVDAIRRVLPLTAAECDALFGRVSSVIHAAVFGRVGIALLQGLAGGVIFYAVGIPGPLFWGLIMAVLCLLPAVGPPLVWIPAAAILFVSGRWIRASIVVLSGIAVIHPIDNILYPVLVGPRIGLRPLILLIAFVGGIIAFGAAGLILGPAIVAIALALGEIWSERARA